MPIRRHTRRAAAVLAALLTVAAVPAVASQPTDGPRPDVCDGAERDVFDDVAGSTFAAAIDCLAAYGIVHGDHTARFRPQAPATRGQTATTLDRLAEVADAQQLPDGDVPYDDVADSTHRDAIGRLHTAGIAHGSTTTRYAPSAQLTRGQAATLHARTLAVLGVDLDDDPPAAFDDTAGTTHQQAIAQLAALDVVDGYGDGTFRPDLPVTRGQLAALSLGTAEVLHDERLWAGIG